MQVTIEKLVFGGQGLARTNGKTIFVWNALPQESVEIEIIKEKKNFAEAVATQVIKPSPLRVEPREAHYLSCSPWQIISHTGETEWKQKIAQETYERIGGLTDVSNLALVSNEVQAYGYRNKMEYGFTNIGGKVCLASYGRNTHTPTPISECALAMPVLTEAAQIIIDWINNQQIPAESCVTLIARCNVAGQVIAGLYLNQAIAVKELPELSDRFIGFTLYQVTDPARVFLSEKVLQQEGSEEITEDILESKLSAGLQSFFQINIPIFKQALLDIGRFIEGAEEVLDFYAGVGAISLPLAKRFHSAMLVESNKQAAQFAQVNIKRNTITNCVAKACAAEEAITEITSQKTLLVDPPRAGLSTEVIDQILRAKPKRVIYLSCDIATHARDIKLLSDKYMVSFLKLYNFFPKTPHIESLCVLNRR